MGNYHNLYLKKDVLLLADVFEKFIDTCLKVYRVDPLSLFQFSWNKLEYDGKNDWCKIRKQIRH